MFTFGYTIQRRFGMVSISKVIPMPKTSTDYNFRSNEKFVIEPIIILTANMMPSKEKLDKAEVMNGRDMQVIGAARERMVNGRMHNEMQ